MKFTDVLCCILIMSTIAFVITAIKVTLQYVNIKISNKVIDSAVRIVQDVVEQVNQTYVNDLKKSDKFDKNCQIEALRKSIELSQKLMSTRMRKFIQQYSGDIVEWIINQVESYISKNKFKSNSNSITKLNG